MNLFDYLLLAILGLSIVLSLWRGFVREIISLIGLVAAFFVASRMSGMAGNYLDQWISNATAANIVGFMLVFVLVMVVVGLIGALIARLVDIADLSATDRTLGMLFGMMRGLFLISLFFLIYTSYAKPDQPWMKKSVITPYAISLGNTLGKVIPAKYPFSRQKGARKFKAKDLLLKIPRKDKQALESIIKKSMK